MTSTTFIKAKLFYQNDLGVYLMELFMGYAPVFCAKIFAIYYRLCYNTVQRMNGRKDKYE